MGSAMTTLYSIYQRSGEYHIAKFDADLNCSSCYILSNGTCDCPQGHKPTCRHRKMLPLFLKEKHIGDGWFLDYDTKLWRKPPADSLSEAHGPLTEAEPYQTNVYQAELDKLKIENELKRKMLAERERAIKPMLNAIKEIIESPPAPPPTAMTPQKEAASVEGAASVKPKGIKRI
jgi:hypothetical protein